jgi:hypothetical protein
MLGQAVDHTTRIALTKVNRAFHGNVIPAVWENIAVDYTNRALYSIRPSEENRLLPWDSLKFYGHHVRTVSVESGTSIVSPPPKG